MSFQEIAMTSGHKLDRIANAQKLLANGAIITITKADDAGVSGTSQKDPNSKVYQFRVNFADATDTKCSCGYYLEAQNAGVKRPEVLCSHQIAGLINADNGAVIVSTPDPVAKPAKERKERKERPAKLPKERKPRTSKGIKVVKSYSFKSKIGREIAKGVEQIARDVLAIIKRGKIPLMSGPTGCGKTSAGRLVARWLNAGLETIAGMESYADADLVGLKTPVGDVLGILARAFLRGRNGEKVVIFIDEVLRFVQRAQNAFMNPLLPTSVEDSVALALEGYDPSFGPTYVTESPAFGRIWTPAKNIVWILGTNPWGAQKDPAFVRRIQAMEVTFNLDILKSVSKPIADFIKLTWDMVDSGSLQLPIEYQAISNMRGPNDYQLITDYLANLKFLDRGQYETLLPIVPPKPTKQPALG